jgi:hypothetical protein
MLRPLSDHREQHACQPTAAAHAARPPHHTHRARSSTPRSPPDRRYKDVVTDADIRMQSRRSSMPFVRVSVLVAVAALVRAAPQHDFKLIAISEEEEAE